MTSSNKNKKVSRKKKSQSKKKTRKSKNEDSRGGGPFSLFSFSREAIILGPSTISTASGLHDTVNNGETKSIFDNTVKKYWEISPEKIFSQNVCKYTVLKCNFPGYDNLYVIALYDVDQNSLKVFWKHIKNISTRLIINAVKVAPFVAIAALNILNPAAYIAAVGALTTAALIALKALAVAAASTVVLGSAAVSVGIDPGIGAVADAVVTTVHSDNRDDSKKKNDEPIVGGAPGTRLGLGNLNYQKAWIINKGFMFVESIARFFCTSPVTNESFSSRKNFTVDYFSTCLNATADIGFLYRTKDFTGANALKNVTTGARLYGGTDGRKPEYDLFSKYKGVFVIYNMETKTFSSNTEGEYFIVDENNKEINPSYMTDEEKLQTPKAYRVNHACGKSNVFGFTTLKLLFADVLESLNFKIYKGEKNPVCFDTLKYMNEENNKKIEKFLSQHSLPHRLYIGEPESFFNEKDKTPSTVVVKVNGVDKICHNVVDKLIWEAFDAGVAVEEKKYIAEVNKLPQSENIQKEINDTTTETVYDTEETQTPP
jgi:hypothetical protein